MYFLRGIITITTMKQKFRIRATIKIDKCKHKIKFKHSEFQLTDVNPQKLFPCRPEMHPGFYRQPRLEGFKDIQAV